jgi:hypothetical protein
MIDIMYCLQTKLTPFLFDEVTSDCEELKKAAFRSHVECYAETGACNLSIQDWKAIWTVVDLETVFGSWDSFKAVFDTMAGCLSSLILAKVGLDRTG